MPLTAGRSVAVDRSVVPFAMPLWVETKLPYGAGQPVTWDHLVFAQDIGTDIKGAGRADLFTGWGRPRSPWRGICMRMAGWCCSCRGLLRILRRNDPQSPGEARCPYADPGTARRFSDGCRRRVWTLW